MHRSLVNAFRNAPLSLGSSTFARNVTSSFSPLPRAVSSPSFSPLHNASFQHVHKRFCSCSAHAMPQIASPSANEGLSIASEEDFLSFTPMKYIEFTCGVCEVRVAKNFTKHAYEKGVVIIRCHGCRNLHLIADNLGFTGHEMKNVEQLAAERGENVITSWEGLIEVTPNK